MVDVTLRASEATLRRVLLRQVNFAKAALLEDLDVDGSVGDVQRFFSYFDRRHWPGAEGGTRKRARPGGAGVSWPWR